MRSITLPGYADMVNMAWDGEGMRENTRYETAPASARTIGFLLRRIISMISSTASASVAGSLGGKDKSSGVWRGFELILA